MPDIHFVDDAAADGRAPDAAASVPDAEGDSAISMESSTDAAEPVKSDAGCPATPPSFATTCCGTHPCSGDCGTVNCGRCAAQCSPSQLCCGKNNSVMCLDTTATCH